MYKKILLGLSLLLILLFIYLGLKHPSLTRNWEPDSSTLPEVSVSGEKLSIKNLRDYTYLNGEIIAREYIDREFDLSKVSNAYFLINPFTGSNATAHTFFTFEFEDGQSFSVSVEARKEVGEKYSAIKGLLNEYELWIAWGTTHDFEERRTKYFKEDLYKYPLLVSTSTVRSVILDLASETERLASKPEFYNTIFSNCTNYLADSANRVSPGSIPWHYARVLTGYSDEYLYKLGLIPHDEPFLKVMEKYKVKESVGAFCARGLDCPVL